jgi:diguanylate cyclase (GGDEF)-like protein/PAS domain S-box-containing protein
MGDEVYSFITEGAAAILLLILLAASTLAGIYARRWRHIPGLQAFPLASLGVILWALGNAFLAFATTPPPRLLAIRCTILGIDLLLVAWLAFVLLYTRGQERLTRLQWAGLLALPLISQLVVTPAPGLTQVQPAIWLDRGTVILWMGVRHSLWGWAHLVAGLLIVLAGVILLVLHLAHTPGSMRKSTRRIAILSLAPMLIFLLESAAVRAQGGLYLTPLAFLASEYAFLWSLKRGTHFQILPVARDFLLEKMDLAVLILNPQGQVIDANPPAAELCGRPVQELLRQPFERLFPAPAASMDWQNRGETTHLETCLEAPAERQAAGEPPRWLDVRLTPLFNDQQVFSGYMVEMRDVTRRRTAEESLRESEQRYRQVIDGMIEGLIVYDANGVVIACNPNAARILGFSREEILGRTIAASEWRAIHEDGSAFDSEEFPGLLALRTGQRQSHVTLGLYQPDDNLVWLLVNSEPLQKDPAQKPYAVVSTFVDITEDRLTAQILRDSENKFRGLLEFAPVAILISDEQGTIQLMNARAEHLFGYSRPEVEGKSIELLIPERYRKTHVRQRDDFVQESRSRPMGMGQQLVARRKDGSEFPVDVGLNLIQTNQGTLVMSYLVDITDRKQAEEALRQANDQLVQSLVELEHRNRELVALTEMGDMLQICASVNEAYAIVASFATRLFPECSGALYMADPTLSWFDPVVAWGDAPPEETPFSADRCWALRRGRPHSAAVAGNELDCQHLAGLELPGYTSYICVPMQAQGEVIGLFHLRWKALSTPRVIDQLAATVAEHISLSLSNLVLRDNLRSQSIRDPLTGVFNRRYMEEAFAHELYRAARHGLPVGVIMLDVDHFKAINDTFGHAYGDSLLQALANFLHNRLRGEDILCRYGGEEFTIILPDTNLENALRLAEKLRTEIPAIETELVIQPLEPIHISLGVAAFPAHGRNAEELIKSADWALYQAKQKGRDQVIAAPSAT